MLKPPEATENLAASPFKGKTGLIRIVHAFFNSMAGLEDAWRHESAFRQEILLAAFLVPLACFAPVTPAERALLIGSVLLLGLLNGFNTRIQQNPAVPPDVKTQISRATETGIPIVTTDQAYQGLRDAGLSSADATTVTDDYGRAQLDALKTSMLAVAFLAVLSFWFTRRLPGKREKAS